MSNKGLTLSPPLSLYRSLSLRVPLSLSLSLSHCDDRNSPFKEQKRKFLHQPRVKRTRMSTDLCLVSNLWHTWPSVLTAYLVIVSGSLWPTEGLMAPVETWWCLGRIWLALTPAAVFPDVLYCTHSEHKDANIAGNRRNVAGGTLV